MSVKREEDSANKNSANQQLSIPRLLPEPVQLQHVPPARAARSSSPKPSISLPLPPPSPKKREPTDADIINNEEEPEHEPKRAKKYISRRRQTRLANNNSCRIYARGSGLAPKKQVQKGKKKPKSGPVKANRKVKKSIQSILRKGGRKVKLPQGRSWRTGDVVSFPFFCAWDIVTKGRIFDEMSHSGTSRNRIKAAKLFLKADRLLNPIQYKWWYNDQVVASMDWLDIFDMTDECKY